MLSIFLILLMNSPVSNITGWCAQEGLLCGKIRGKQLLQYGRTYNSMTSRDSDLEDSAIYIVETAVTAWSWARALYSNFLVVVL